MIHIMDFSQSLEVGKFLEVNTKPDRVIETLLSKLFFFGDKVYKHYKWNKAFYGDLSDLSFRREFIQEDFFWNHSMSPDIYLTLLFVKKEKGIWKETTAHNAEDFCIVMKVIESDQTLTHLAEKALVTKEMLSNVVKEMIPRVRSITIQRGGALKNFLQKPLRKTLEQELQDLRDWAYMGNEYISHKEVDAIVDMIRLKSKSIDYFDSKKVRIEASIDGNPDNVLLLKNGEVKFIDVMPPKINWRAADEFFNICRYATEITTFMDEKTARALYETYTVVTNVAIPEEVKVIYELRSALIMVTYRFVLGQKERAQKSLDFLKRTMKLI